MGKYVFSSRPQHPFIEEPISPPYTYNLRSKKQVNKYGKPKGIGKLTYQPSKKRYIILCYDKECDAVFRR